MSKLRESARGEDCQVRIPGVCRWLPEYTILSHYPGEAGGRGRSLKSIDLNSAYCCTACDAVVDRQAKPPQGMTYQDCMTCWFEGHMRTLLRMKEKGLI